MASSITSYGTVSAANGNLYYEQEGNKSGPAVLFIHGLGGTTNTYQPLVSALQDFNLVRFDWAGHGRSSVPKSTSIDSYVEDALGSSAPSLRFRSALLIPNNSRDQAPRPQECDGRRPLPGLSRSHDARGQHPSVVTKLVLFGPIKSPAQAGQDGARARAEAVRLGGMAKVADTIVGNAFSAKSLKSRTEVVAFGREMLCRQDPEGYALACLALANSLDPRVERHQGCHDHRQRERG